MHPKGKVQSVFQNIGSFLLALGLSNAKQGHFWSFIAAVKFWKISLYMLIWQKCCNFRDLLSANPGTCPLKVTIVEIKLRTPKLQIVTTLNKHECSELVISLCYEVILQFLSWLMNAFTSEKTHANIQKILSPRDTQQISIFDVVYNKQHHKLWRVGEN